MTEANESSTRLRVGLRRTGRPHGSVATAEASIIRHELERRVGPISLDLRISGEQLGDWQPEALAAWPAAIDVSVDASPLWKPGVPPLTCLFVRTVSPKAADVRRRMLHHLGILPLDVASEVGLAELGELRPLDLWLVISEARSVELTDPGLLGFRLPHDDAAAALDEMFDDLAAEIHSNGVVEASASAHISRLTDHIHDLEVLLSTLTDDALRDRVEHLDRIDELTAENQVLHERLRRLELDGTRVAGQT